MAKQSKAKSAKPKKHPVKKSVKKPAKKTSKKMAAKKITVKKTANKSAAKKQTTKPKSKLAKKVVVQDKSVASQVEISNQLYKQELAEENHIFDDINQASRSKFVVFVEFLLFGVLVFIAASLVLTERAFSPNKLLTTTVELPEKQQIPDDITGRYLFAGTLVWDRNIEEWSKDAEGSIDPEHPFSNLDSYSPELYNAWVGDLECPVSEEDVPYELGLTTLEFNCRPEYLPYAAQYFKFFNLANNHSENSGPEKLEETRQALEAQDIQYFGDPEPGKIDDLCQVVALPVDLVYKNSETAEQGFVPVAFCAFHYFFRLPEPSEIKEIEKYAQHMPVFAYLHMGTEYKTNSNSAQQQVARSIIDAGAEFVIGNNPHWVQEAEVYNGKLIVYSTGNFIFDQTWSQEVRSSVSIDTSVTFDASNESLSEWLSLGESCGSYADTCLDKAASQGLKKLEINLDFLPIAGTIDKDQPQVRADQDVQDFVEDRLGWKEVLAELKKAD